MPLPVNGPPAAVVLANDEHHAEYVGRSSGGRQFFLTTPFVPADQSGADTGREFIALYVFDSRGTLESAVIEDLGPRSRTDEAARVRRRDALLASLGDVTHAPISVAPFRIERFGVEFGFIPRPPEEPDEDWCVIVEPGNYMCFWPPWDTGDYDT